MEWKKWCQIIGKWQFYGLHLAKSQEISQWLLSKSIWLLVTSNEHHNSDINQGIGGILWRNRARQYKSIVELTQCHVMCYYLLYFNVILVFGGLKRLEINSLVYFVMRLWEFLCECFNLNEYFLVRKLFLAENYLSKLW